MCVALDQTEIGVQFGITGQVKGVIQSYQHKIKCSPSASVRPARLQPARSTRGGRRPPAEDVGEHGDSSRSISSPSLRYVRLVDDRDQIPSAIQITTSIWGFGDRTRYSDRLIPSKAYGSTSLPPTFCMPFSVISKTLKKEIISAHIIYIKEHTFANLFFNFDGVY